MFYLKFICVQIFPPKYVYITNILENLMNIPQKKQVSIYSGIYIWVISYLTFFLLENI